VVEPNRLPPICRPKPLRGGRLAGLPALVVVLGLLGGCGEGKRADSTVFDTQIKALQKARETESVVRQGEQRKHEAVESIEERPSN